MTDWFTDEIFGGVSGATDVIFPVSRLVVDPERFEHDDDEPMSKQGMGVIYELTSNQGPLRLKPNAAERSLLIDSYYRPHHRLLTDMTKQAITEYGNCLIIDGHSFPRLPLPYESDHSLERPEICIGTDDYHTPDNLRDEAVALFEKAGFTVAVNSPFAGALVPLDYYRSDKRVMGLMIEVRRDLYIDETTAEKLPEFDGVRDKIKGVISQVIDVAEDIL